MPATVIIGTQWGDEGKGKITDIYAKEADIIARFQGGNNAGHTLVVEGNTYKFHLLPSGIIRQDKLAVISNGLVVDPEILIGELKKLREMGLKAENLKISDRSHVILDYHKILDNLEENRRGKGKVGTTGRGIGPSYTDKVSRHGIRIMDLLSREILRNKLEGILPQKDNIFKIHGDQTPLLLNELVEKYSRFGEVLRSYVCDTSVLLNKALDEGKHVLFEGAQGTMLDIDHGTFPYVTSSNTVAGGACIGAGIGPKRISKIIGVVKAYTTRVGAGPHPTELTDELGEKLREKGGEYGTTTGRPRRCGWLDLVVVKHALRLSSIDALAITKIDVLDGIDPINICVGYEHNGKILTDFPANLGLLEECRSVYEQTPGWNSAEEIINKLDEGLNAIPKEMQDYVKFIEERCGVPVEMISFGPEREKTLDLRDK
jgi:adenylosuccinate synthase